jgi:hypothetical protein
MSILETFLEVRLASEEDFLKIKETLTRIGVASRKEKKLYQSCHILHKQGRYYVVHFKELFALDGKVTDFSDEDRGRRNTIAQLLEDWNLVEIMVSDESFENKVPMSQIKIITHKEKKEWLLEAKYTIGKKRNI